MSEITDFVDKIDCYYQDIIVDEAVIYKKNDRYYIDYIGLGKTRRITKNQYDVIKRNMRC